MWNHDQVRLETGLCRCKIIARSAPKIPWALKSFWMHPMVLLGDNAQVEARCGPIGDSAKLYAR
jgi:hypothetical protein